MTRRRPWEKLTEAERIEAIRRLAAEHSNSIIAYKLGAPVSAIVRIAAGIRREIERDQESVPLGAVLSSLAAREADESAASNLPEGANGTMGGLPVAAASGTAEETGRNPAYAIRGRSGTPSVSGVTAAETASIFEPTGIFDEHDSAQPESFRRGRHMAVSSAPRNRAGHVSADFQLDDGAIAAVKGTARLANAVGVEPPSSTPRPWADMAPEEKRAAVRELFVAGTSYIEIAKLLGAPDRNCVAGVVNRIRKAGELPPARGRKSIGSDGGITSKVKAKRARMSRKLQPKADAPRKPKASGLAAINIAVRTEHRADAPGISISRAAAFDPIPDVEPVDLVDLTSTTCRWPVSGLMGRESIFCGAECEIERSYCTSHRLLAYQSPRERAA